ncbi:MAG: hypothetical protein JXA87_05505 [Thermoleophilia bacterium]|nr:hypothetical protein [Thermoleophilia bacterium]
MIDHLSFLSTVLTRSLPRYLAILLRSSARPAHVLFCMVDHYEPGTGGVDSSREEARVADLLTRYPQLADAHIDAAGRCPRRTWFFPPHYHRHGSLRRLVSLCERGYGEIELHLHHGKIAPDTTENLRHTIALCLRDYSQFGIFGMQEGRRRYGFIHGDYALNNSLPGQKYCGVDNELSVLAETGCYADFTFPSCTRSNPRQINTIHYADTRLKGRKAYASGTRAKVGTERREGLLIVQGPVRPVWVDGRLTFGDAINNRRPLTKRLIAAWIGTSIHVAGKRDWVVVKIHTHGAAYADAVLGSSMHEGLTHLETAYNDGKKHVLHYVTARELYNVIRAAEAGETGDPTDYLDYCVAPPRYDSSPDIAQASDELRAAVSATYGEWGGD